MNKIREQALQMRDDGYSYNLISSKLGVSKSTLSYWFRDVPFTPNAEVKARIAANVLQAGVKAHERRMAEIATLRARGEVEVGKLSNRDLMMLGIGMYMGEGAKTIEALRISNADPVISRLGVTWLTRICGLSLENITIRLHVYPDVDVQEATRYWQRQTSIPLENFRSVVVDRRLNKQKRHSNKLPYGTAHISVIAKGDTEKGVRLYRRIMGWISAVATQV